MVALALSALFSFVGILDTCIFQPKRDKARRRAFKEQLAQQWREAERQMAEACNDTKEHDG
jgi:hypothetical protein